MPGATGNTFHQIWCFVPHTKYTKAGEIPFQQKFIFLCHYISGFAETRCSCAIWKSDTLHWLEYIPAKLCSWSKCRAHTIVCLYRGGWKKWQENSRVFFQSETCICRRSWEVFGNTVVLKYLQMDLTVSSSLVFLIFRFLRLTAWGKFTFK